MAKPQHTKKLFGGRTTAEDLHSQYAIRSKCRYCGAPGNYRVRLLAAVEELLIRNPAWCATVAAMNPNGPFVPSFDTKYGKMTCFSDMAFCKSCRPRVEKEAAQMTMKRSWIYVDFDWGPGPDKVIA